MTDKDKIREEVKRLQDLTMDENKNFYSEAAEGEYNALCNIEHFIDSLQEEPDPQFKVGDTIRSKVWELAVHEIVSMDDSAYYFENGGMVRFDDQGQWELAEETVNEVWHDGCENPKSGTNILMIRKEKEDSNFPPIAGRFYGTDLHSDGIKWGYYNGFCYNEIEPPVKWAYIDDILNLSNVERIGKERIEMPISEDLEDFALQYAGHHAPYDDCMQEVIDAVKAGAKWQEEKDNEEKVLTYKHGFEDCKKQISEDSKKELPKIWDRETLNEYAYQVAYDLSNDWMRETATWDDVETAVKLGAKWQKEREKMDKIQKIRKEVERIQLYSQSETLRQVLEYIDKVEKEPDEI